MRLQETLCLNEQVIPYFGEVDDGKPENWFDLLTLSVAKLLHCSKAHVGKVVAGLVNGCGPIPSLHLGRRTLIRRSALLIWIERNKVNANLQVFARMGCRETRIGASMRRRHQTGGLGKQRGRWLGMR